LLHPGPLTAAGALKVDVEAGASSALDAVAEAADSAHGFLRARWYAAAAGSAPLVTLCARRADSGAPVVALPLVPRRIGPLRLREVPGSYWPYRSFPLAKDLTGDELADFLASPEARSALGRAWRLGPVHGDDPTVLRLAQAARSAGWTMLSRKVATCFDLDLARLTASGTWPSSKRRQTLRWRERRLAQQGELTYTLVNGEQWNPGVLDVLAAAEAESWVVRDGGDPKFLRGTPCRAAWEGAIADPALADRLVGWILQVGGEPAAFVFGLDAGPVRHVIANGYSERFAEGSPGLLVLFRAFQDSASAGVAKISWGAGDAGYKSQMGAEEGPDMVDLLFVRGALLAAVARPVWRRGA